MYEIQLIRIGNHYYPNLNHSNPNDLKLDPKFDRMLNIINQDDLYFPTVRLYEVGDVLPDEGLIKINEDDITRYLTTDDHFDLRVDVNGHRFKLSSGLYTVLEKNLHLDLCKTLYKIEIW